MAGYSLIDSPYWGVPNRLHWNPSAPPGSQNLIGDPRRRRKLTPAQVLPSARATQEILSAPNPQFMGGALPQAVMTPQQRQHAMRSRTFNRAPAPFVDVGQGDYYGRDADDESLGMKDWSGHAAQEQRRVKDGTTAPRPEEIASWMQRERLRLQKELDPEVRHFEDSEYGKTFGKQGGLLEQVDEWIRTPTKTGESAYADTMISDEGDRIEENQAEVVLGRGGTKSLGEVMFPDPDDQMEARRVASGEKAPLHDRPISGVDQFRELVKTIPAVPDHIISHTPEHKAKVAATVTANEEAINKWVANRTFDATASGFSYEEDGEESETPTVTAGDLKGDVEKSLKVATKVIGVPTQEAVKTATATPEQNAERIWGNFSRDSGSKRTKYLSAMNDMYKKMMILNVIAALTGSESQAPLFMEMATAKMQALDKFDGMDRLDSIRRGVFYTKDGKFDPPKSRLMAFRRAIRFGANEKEAASLSGHHPTPSKTPAGFQTWSRVLSNGRIQEKTFASGVRPPDDGKGEWIEGRGREGTGKERYARRVEQLVADGKVDQAGAILAKRFYDKEVAMWGMPPNDKRIREEVEKQLGFIRRSSPQQAQVVQPVSDQSQETDQPANLSPIMNSVNSLKREGIANGLKGDELKDYVRKRLVDAGYNISG